MKKRLSFTDALIFFVNSIFAMLLLASYLLPHIKPSLFPLLAVLSLSVPVLIAINMCFCLYWLVKLKRQILLSFAVLAVGLSHIESMYRFPESKVEEASDKPVSLMSYNVRLFNKYRWIDSDSVLQQIKQLVEIKKPDIVCFQEYHPVESLSFNYPYRYDKIAGTKVKQGQVILSKFPIIHTGSIDFPKTSNNAIFADVVVHQDTIRVYNIHFQSLKINTEEDFKNENSERLIKRFSNTFKIQEQQAQMVIDHKHKSPYKCVVAGDFNNTAYSYVYNAIKKENMSDAFQKAGSGFGKTYKLNIFPLRIDFILLDKTFVVEDFKTIHEKLSDHYPIQTTFRIP